MEELSFPPYLMKVCKYCGQKDTFYYGDLECECKNKIFFIYKSRPIMTDYEKKIWKEYRSTVQQFYNKNKLNEHNTSDQIKNGTCWGIYGDDRVLLIKDSHNNIVDQIDIVKYTEKIKQFGDEKIEVKSKCCKCGKEYTLFDSSKYGYDAIIDEKDRKYKDNQMIQVKNCKCGNNRYRVRIGISNLGREDFIENCPDMDPQLWIEAFDWITIDLVCSECGKIRKKWFDYETM